MEAPRSGSVGIIVTVERSKYLLQLRDDFSSIFFPNLLGMFGGSTDDGETSQEAAAREFGEELGLPIPLERFKEIGRTTFNSIYFQGNARRERVFFLVDLSCSEEAQLELKEGAALKSFSMSETPSLVDLVPTDVLALRLFLMVANDIPFEPRIS